MAQVELLLTPLPVHVSTARLVGVSVARRCGLDEELVDELRLALGEAVGRAVLLGAQHAPSELVRIVLRDDPAGLTVSVSDRGPADVPEPREGTAADLITAVEPVQDGDDDPDPAVALAVIAGLVDDLEVTPDAEGATVTMRWPLPPQL